MISSNTKAKRDKLSRAMADAGIDACLIGSPVNLYYLCDRIFDGYFYMDAQGESFAFVRRGEAPEGLRRIDIRKPEQIGEMLCALSIPLPKTVMLEDDYLSAAVYMRLAKVFGSAQPRPDILRPVRSMKTDAEVELLKASAAFHARAYAGISSLYRTGMTDTELTVEIERLMRQNGALGLLRLFGTGMEIHMGSVLAGDNASVRSPYDFAVGGAGVHPSLPISVSGERLREGTSVMVDMGGNFTGYISDMTRTFSVGKLPQRAYDLHNLSIDIQNELSLAGPGDYCAGLYEKAVGLVKKHGGWDEYMENIQGSRFVGHGVGLEVNELPVLNKTSKAVLVENMCIALEPKFVLPGVGAVGVENTYIVRKNGLEKITLAPEEIIAFE